MLITQSFPQLCFEFEKNKDVIKKYIAEKQGLIENFTNPSATYPVPFKILGFGIGFFLLLFLINLIMFVWAIVVFVKFSKTMPKWAVVLFWILIIFTGPLFPLILVYTTKNTKNNYSLFKVSTFIYKT